MSTPRVVPCVAQEAEANGELVPRASSLPPQPQPQEQPSSVALAPQVGQNKGSVVRMYGSVTGTKCKPAACASPKARRMVCFLLSRARTC